MGFSVSFVCFVVLGRGTIGQDWKMHRGSAPFQGEDAFIGVTVSDLVTEGEIFLHAGEDGVEAEGHNSLNLLSKRQSYPFARRCG